MVVPAIQLFVWALPLWIPFWPLPVAMILMLAQLLADVVLALGTRLNPFSTLPGYGIDYWPKEARIIQVDINADRIGLTKKVTVGIQGGLTHEGFPHVEGAGFILQLEQHVIEVARLLASGVNQGKQGIAKALSHAVTGLEHCDRYQFVCLFFHPVFSVVHRQHARECNLDSDLYCRMLPHQTLPSVGRTVGAI